MLGRELWGAALSWSPMHEIAMICAVLSEKIISQWLRVYFPSKYDFLKLGYNCSAQVNWACDAD